MYNRPSVRYTKALLLSKYGRIHHRQTLFTYKTPHLLPTLSFLSVYKMNRNQRNHRNGKRTYEPVFFPIGSTVWSLSIPTMTGRSLTSWPNTITSQMLDLQGRSQAYGGMGRTWMCQWRNGVCHNENLHANTIHRLRRGEAEYKTSASINPSSQIFKSRIPSFDNPDSE